MQRALSVAAGIGAALAFAPAALADAEPGRIERDVRVLASASFAGRGIDGPGASAAAGYIVARLLAAGAQPLDSGNFFEPVPLLSHASDGVVVSLGMGRERAIGGADLSLSGAVTQPLDVTAPVVVIYWSGAEDSAAAWGGEVVFTGRIAIFANLGDHAAQPPPQVLALFQQALAEKPALMLTATDGLAADLKAQQAFEAQEEAVAAQGPAWRYTLAGEAAPLSGAIDRDWLLRALPALARMDGGGVMVTPPASLAVSLTNYRTRRHDALNVIARVPGMNADLPPILFSAHYDHLGAAGGTFYPGADDNASGVAVLLELARTLAERPAARTAEFVFFTGEEHGLLGSRAFAQRHAATLSRYAYLVNIDAVGRAAGDDPANAGTIFEQGLACLPQARRAFDSAFAQVPLTLVAFGDFPMLAPMAAPCDLLATGQGGAPSDQLSLAAQGLQGILLHGGLSADYHQPTDTPDKVLYARLEQISAALDAVVRASD